MMRNTHILINILYILYYILILIVFFLFFFFNDTATTEIYTPLYTLSLHDALPIAVISGHGVTLRLERSKAAPPVMRLLCDFTSLPKGTPHELIAPNGMKIELVEANPLIEVPEGKQEFVISRVGDPGAWDAGRASMQYRDLIPSRL